ncbi:hypothetical protein [Streptomyces sp. NRRL S-1813]|uniref:hypothetical protein n=1 Tax=Streptomyces sp. NRRL S-1813 TaxID=1463888 RepID=UPI00099D2CD3|nr:hypothetical protein [Streptomyces sp. NRRL S-1813]
MLDCISRIFEPLLRLLWPALGRHRSLAEAVHAEPPVDVTRAPSRPPEPVLRGEGSPLVRPYLVAYERQEVQRQRARRRALWLALHGVGIGPRLIHGVEVTA